jgi:drug/metabolite transporter (DMT)-like permease
MKRIAPFKALAQSKKAFTYGDDWAEFFFILLFFVGVFLMVLSPNKWITYLISFVSGLAAGRIVYERRDKGKAPFWLIVIGFALGIVAIGQFMGKDGRIIFLLFLLGAGLMYYLFDKKIIKDILI